MKEESSAPSLSGFEADQPRFVTITEPKEELSIIRIIGITAALLGYQLSYSCNFSIITPIIGRLRFASYMKSIVWCIAPICDFLVQTTVGYYSDKCHSRLGRRRPFIITGGVGLITSVLIMFFCENIGHGISEKHWRTVSQVFFIIAFTIMNISLNTIQCPARALISDILPDHQKVVGYTIATIMNGLGAIIVNLIGGLSLYKYTPLSNEKFLFTIGFISALVTILITSLVSPERRFNIHVETKNVWVELFNSFRYAPAVVIRAAISYFLGWCAIFAYLVEITNYFGEIIYSGEASDADPVAHQKYVDGVNFGMLTLAVMYSVSLLYGFIQPTIVKLIGAKLSLTISMFIAVVVFIAFNFIFNKWVLLFLFGLLGIPYLVLCSIPFTIVSMSVSEKDVGKNFGVVNAFGCFGQQLANLSIVYGVAAALPDRPNLLIALETVFAFATGIFAHFLIVPEEKKQAINSQPLLG